MSSTNAGFGFRGLSEGQDPPLSQFERRLLARPKSEVALSRAAVFNLIKISLGQGSKLPAWTDGSLKNWVQALGEGERKKLSESWGEENITQLDSLAQEPVEEMFVQGLLVLGRELILQNRLTAASATFTLAQASERFPEIASAAQKEIDILQGKGTFAERLPFFSQQALQELVRPEPILAMGLASVAFRWARLGALTGLAGSTNANLFTRGLGLKLSSNFLGLMAESSVFTLSSKSLAALEGVPQDFSLNALGKDFASTALLLGSLRLSGALTGSLAEKLAPGDSLLDRGTRALAPQLGMYGGILTAQKLDDTLHLKPANPGSNPWMDGLFTWFHFNVGGTIAHQFLGSRFQSWERGIDLSLKHFEDSSGPKAPGVFSNLVKDWKGQWRNFAASLEPKLSPAGGPPLVPNRDPADKLQDLVNQPLQMSSLRPVTMASGRTGFSLVKEFNYQLQVGHVFLDVGTRDPRSRAELTRMMVSWEDGFTSVLHDYHTKETQLLRGPLVALLRRNSSLRNKLLEHLQSNTNSIFGLIDADTGMLQRLVALDKDSRPKNILLVARTSAAEPKKLPNYEAIHLELAHEPQGPPHIKTRWYEFDSESKTLEEKAVPQAAKVKGHPLDPAGTDPQVDTLWDGRPVAIELLSGTERALRFDVNKAVLRSWRLSDAQEETIFSVSPTSGSAKVLLQWNLVEPIDLSKETIPPPPPKPAPVPEHPVEQAPDGVSAPTPTVSKLRSQAPTQPAKSVEVPPRIQKARMPKTILPPAPDTLPPDPFPAKASAKPNGKAKKEAADQGIALEDKKTAETPAPPAKETKKGKKEKADESKATPAKISPPPVGEELVSRCLELIQGKDIPAGKKGNEIREKKLAQFNKSLSDLTFAETRKIWREAALQLPMLLGMDDAGNNFIKRLIFNLPDNERLKAISLVSTYLGDESPPLRVHAFDCLKLFFEDMTLLELKDLKVYIGSALPKKLLDGNRRAMAQQSEFRIEEEIKRRTSGGGSPPVGALALLAGLGTLAYSQTADAANVISTTIPHAPNEGVVLALLVGSVLGLKALLAKASQLRAAVEGSEILTSVPNLAREVHSRLTGRVLKRSIEGSDQDGSAKSYPYELHLNNFNNFLQDKFADTVAWRDGKEIRATQIVYRPVDEGEGYPEGTHRLTLHVAESGKGGNLMLFVEKDTLNLYSIQVRHLGKGAGTILLDWLATQAAANGWNFNVRSVEEPQVFRILQRNQLLVPGSDTIEGTYIDPQSREDVKVKGTMADAVFPEEPWSASYHLFAKPNPGLVPPSLRKK